MSYRVQITKTETVKCQGGRKWEIVRTEAEADALREKYGKDLDDDHDGVYGYTPPYDATKEQSVDVLDQVVEELDLIGVIKAINGIS